MKHSIPLVCRLLALAALWPAISLGQATEPATTPDPAPEAAPKAEDALAAELAEIDAPPDLAGKTKGGTA